MKKLKMNYKNIRGITLISLVVTIVVLLILAGVTINMLLGDNGILTRVAEAKEKTKEEENKELEQLDNLEKLIAQYTSEKGKVVTTKYYESLLSAINDANNDVITNGADDSSGAKAKIEINEKGNVYVSPLEDASLDTIVQVGSAKGYTLDLNNKTLTFSEGNHFNQLASTKLILDDSGTNGNVTKNVTASSTQNIIRSSGELILNGGTYNLTNNGTGTALNFRMDKAIFVANSGVINSIGESKATALQVTGSNSTTTINNVNCSAKSVSGQASSLLATASGPDEENGNIIINGGEFTSFSELAQALAGYFMFKNATINGGVFNAKSNASNSSSYGLDVVNRNNITINNVEVNSVSNNYSYGIYLESSSYGEPKFIIDNAKVTASTNNSGKVFGIMVKDISNDECKINGGEYCVDGNTGLGVAAYVENSYVEINNGKFIADGKLVSEGDAATYGLLGNSENIIVNEGYFRGTHSGATFMNGGYINGGTFESPNHGGIYAGGNVNIKNATLKLGTYKGIYSEMANVSHYGVFYIGNPTVESTVYMDNVTLVSDFGNKPGVLSSNYNYKDTYLYVSNTVFPGPIRVDGTRSASENPTAQGHLYVGKNVTYSGITTGSESTTGVVDTTTYANTEFLQD